MHQQHCGVMLTNAVKQISYKNLNIRHYQIAHKGYFFALVNINVNKPFIDKTTPNQLTLQKLMLGGFSCILSTHL